MFKIILTIFCTFLVNSVSAQFKNIETQLEIKLSEELSQKTISLWVYKENQYILYDSCSSKTERIFHLSISEPTYAYLRMDAQRKSFILIPGSNTMAIITDQLGHGILLKNTVDKDYNDYNETIASPAKAELIKITRLKSSLADKSILDSLNERQKKIETTSRIQTEEFIKKHPKSFYSMMLLANYIAAWESSKLISLYDCLDSSLAHYPTSLRVKQEIDRLRIQDAQAVFTLPQKKQSFDYNSTAFKNSKYYLIEFWGSWCKPCLRSISLLTNRKKWLDSIDVQVIGIACENANQPLALKKTIAAMKINWPQIVQILDKNGQNALTEKYSVRLFPTYYLLDKNLKILDRKTGEDGLIDLLQNLTKGFADTTAK